jgi:hypothetical protein
MKCNNVTLVGKLSEFAFKLKCSSEITKIGISNHSIP